MASEEEKRTSEEAPPLQKVESYARREKSGKNFVKPKLVVRGQKKSSIAKRLSMTHLTRKSLGPQAGAKKKSQSSAKKKKNLFDGNWVSKSVDGAQGFLQELEVSKEYMKLAKKYAGSQKQTLQIKQDGDEFTIISSNDRRETIISFVIGVPFFSETEKGETTTCMATWEDGDGQRTLCICSQRNSDVESGIAKEVLVRRELLASGEMEEKLTVMEAKKVKNTASRLYKKKN